jgi:hypothetical protein
MASAASCSRSRRFCVGVGGGTDGGSAAAIDSLLVYDWCLPEAEATRRVAPGGFTPIPFPDEATPSVYLWGNSPEKTERLAVNLRNCRNGRRGTKVSASLSKVVEGGLQKLSTGGVGAYEGTAAVVLEYEPAAPPVGAADVGLGEGDGTLEGLDDLLGDETQYVLKIRATAAGEDPPPRDITFTYGGKDTGARYFE